MGTELLLLRRRALMMADSMVLPTLLYIDQAEISMCCKDGTDGKDGVYQLTPIFSDGLTHLATWTTSDASKATVDSSGLVSFSSATSFGDVTISCSYRGVTKSCLLTVYATMPTTREACALLKGGKGPGLDSNSVYAVFTSGSVPSDNVLAYFRLGITFLVPSGDSYSQFSTLKSSTKQHYCPIEYQYNSGRKRPSASYWVGSVKKESFYGTEMPTRSTQSIDFIKASDGVFINGSTASLHSSISGNFTAGNSFAAAFRQNTKKSYFLTHCQSSTKNEIVNSPKDRDYSCLFQNYIRYTDRTVGGTTRVNYTVIPNIGTLGSAFDLSCNNVPSAWFGV